MYTGDLGSRARYAFTTRLGGVSREPYDSLNLGGHVGDDPAAVTRNRELAAQRLGLRPAGVAWMEQVHGATVTVVDGPGPGPVAGCDALVTATPGLALAVLIADCLPVLLADGDAGVVAAAHAGRRGLQDGVLAATLTAMSRLGARPGAVRAIVGPGIGGCCYEVPAVMQDEVAAAVPAARATTRSGTPALDLPAAAAAQLAAAGVPAPGRAGGCTYDDPASFSYRRDRTTGRLAGYVWLPQ